MLDAYQTAAIGLRRLGRDERAVRAGGPREGGRCGKRGHCGLHRVRQCDRAAPSARAEAGCGEACRRRARSPAARSSRFAARRSRSAMTGSSARRRSRSGPRGRTRTRSRSRSRCGRPASSASSRSGSCGRRACSTARRCSARPAAIRGTLSQPDDTIAGPPVAAVRRLEGGRAPFRGDGVVRDLRQGLDRRGRAPRRPDSRPDRSSSRVGHPRPARPASRRPARLRRDGRPARGRPVHSGRRAHRDPRGRRAPQRPRQARRLAGAGRRDAAPRPGR